jgi:hypothetical protein
LRGKHYAEGGVDSNPRDFKKLAPVLGVLLLVALVVYVVGRFLW